MSCSVRRAWLERHAAIVPSAALLGVLVAVLVVALDLGVWAPHLRGLAAGGQAPVPPFALAVGVKFTLRQG